MRHARLLGLALMAVFAFGVLAAASASATEPSGFLYLPGQEGPVQLSGSSTTAAPTFRVEGDAISCTKLEGSGEAGKGEGTHSTLGSATLDYTGCKEPAKKAGCRSENAAGEKDPAETILRVAAGTDVHGVSLENAEGKLVPGVLVGDLEVEAGGKKQDLTANCGLVKIFILGALFFEVKGATQGTDLETVEVVPTNTAKCDKNDTLCKKLLETWGAVVGGKLCPLAARLAETEFCASSSVSNPVKVKFSKDVLIDF